MWLLKGLQHQTALSLYTGTCIPPSPIQPPHSVSPVFIPLPAVSDRHVATNETGSHRVPPSQTWFGGVPADRYVAWVRAESGRGAGRPGPHLVTAPTAAVPAAVWSFGARLVARWRQPLTLHCRHHGQPAPQLSWLRNGRPLTASDRSESTRRPHTVHRPHTIHIFSTPPTPSTYHPLHIPHSPNVGASHKTADPLRIGRVRLSRIACCGHRKGCDLTFF